MENIKKTNKRILLGLFDPKTQPIKEIAEIANRQLKKVEELRKENLTTEELQKAVKPYIARTTTVVKKENKIIKVFVAIFNWTSGIVVMLIQWFILFAFFFLPPFLIVLIVWMLSGIEPNVYATLSALTLFIIYYLMIFKTRLGQKWFDWMKKIARI